MKKIIALAMTAAAAVATSPAFAATTDLMSTYWIGR